MIGDKKEWYCKAIGRHVGTMWALRVTLNLLAITQDIKMLVRKQNPYTKKKQITNKICCSINIIKFNSKQNIYCTFELTEFKLPVNHL